MEKPALSIWSLRLRLFYIYNFWHFRTLYQIKMPLYLQIIFITNCIFVSSQRNDCRVSMWLIHHDNAISIFWLNYKLFFKYANPVLFQCGISYQLPNEKKNLSNTGKIRRATLIDLIKQVFKNQAVRCFDCLFIQWNPWSKSKVQIGLNSIANSSYPNTKRMFVYDRKTPKYTYIFRID